MLQFKPFLACSHRREDIVYFFLLFCQANFQDEKNQSCEMTLDFGMMELTMNP